ncbi:MAG: hypothetical protein AAFP76_01570 [Bacteroidota bacterium]
MLLIHLQKITPRTDYAFKHICTRILGIKVEFTSVIETFIAHQGPKLSYGRQPMGNELFIQAHGLLFEQGFEDIDIVVQTWNESIGFFPVGARSALPFDIFSAAFYLLSRYEEYLPHLKDDLGRFPAEESLAYKNNFLKKPVVDIWANYFKKILLQHYPDTQFANRSLHVHHMVEATEPFAYSQRGFLRNFSGFFRDLIRFRIQSLFRRSRVLMRLRKDPFDTFTWMINASKNSTAKLSVFFLLGEGFSFQEDINSKREKYRMLVKFVADYVEVGLTFSYHSLDDYDRLKQEKLLMEELTHRSLRSSRNDKSLVNLPHNYRNLLELEVEKDTTLLYDDHLGFRAGTCTPFLFYDLDYEIKTPLIIHPMAGRTSTLSGQKKGIIESEVYQLLTEVKNVGGTFSILLSNKDFMQKNV